MSTAVAPATAPLRQSPVPRASSDGRADRAKRLARRWRRFGDEEAREALVLQFMPLARKLALRYANSPEPLEDLIQVAHVGLVHAVDRFDPDRGVRFSSFAVPTILGELRRHFRDTRWAVHVPRKLKERSALLEDAADDIAGLTGQSPSPGDLAEATGMTLEEVVEALQIREAHSALSLDGPGDPGDEITLGSRVACEEPGYGRIDEASVVWRTMAALREDERQVLALRLFEDLTQSEIAGRLDISHMQVSRLLRRAASRLQTVVAAGTGSV
jgi:RNA polymerase sigma-B factor